MTCADKTVGHWATIKDIADHTEVYAAPEVASAERQNYRYEQPVKTPEKLVEERGGTHGDWRTQALLANTIRRKMRGIGHFKDLPPYRQEALDMIVTKISRICSGDADHADHWDDIAGYAVLGKSGHSETPYHWVDIAGCAVSGKSGPPKTP